MVPVLERKTMTFDEFIDWYPENQEQRYELHHGELIKMPKPTGPHSQLIGVLSFNLMGESQRMGQPYFIPRECIVKPRIFESGYEPDIAVLDRTHLADEPRWEKSSVITQGRSVPLIVEVVSSNWQDDYALKLEAYQDFGVREYWIVDYRGLGGTFFIGKPKRPVVTICCLENGVYRLSTFRGDERLVSPTFSELQLTANQVFAMAAAQ